jgi:hypothetical protein
LIPSDGESAECAIRVLGDCHCRYPVVHGYDFVAVIPQIGIAKRLI